VGITPRALGRELSLPYGVRVTCAMQKDSAAPHSVRGGGELGHPHSGFKKEPEIMSLSGR
jgi:hypothetical protein